MEKVTAYNMSGVQIPSNAAVAVVPGRGDRTAIILANAMAGSNIPARGFTTVAVLNNVNTDVVVFGIMDGFAGLQIGQDYWIDPAQPGQITPQFPNLPGQMAQYVGWATSETELFVDIQRPIRQA